MFKEHDIIDNPSLIRFNIRNIIRFERGCKFALNIRLVITY